MFHKKISIDHLTGIHELSKKYRLGYEFRSEEYQDAPCILARNGFFVAKSVDNAGILIFYVPEFISDNQCMWYSENIHLFSKYSMLGAYVIRNSENGYQVDERSNLDVNQLYMMMNQKNVMYHKNQSCKKK